MITIQRIREERSYIAKRLKVRGYSDDELSILDRVVQLDDKRKNNQTSLDELLRQVNQLSRQIGSWYKKGKTVEAEEAKTQVARIKEESKKFDEAQREVLTQIEELLLSIPNVPHPTVPAGSTAEDNQVVKTSGHMPTLHEGALPHWELGKEFGILDFEMGTKLTGPGFPVFRGPGAQLQRALVAFFLDEGAKAGYEEFIPPLMVNEASARATGQLPDKEGQMYHVQTDNLYLIPTAEVPLTNILRDVVLDLDQLPVKMTGYTPCFRREAGSYGADVKGLNRVHQFDKVEIVQVTESTRSYDALEEMVEYVGTLLDKLELPYRVLRLCGGDLGFTSALTYDFEVFSGAQKKWLEVSSVSNFETFQSNRLKLRYKDADGKKQLAHTLNGSALALARIMAALLENNQGATGVKVPDVLVPYTKFELIKHKS